MLLAAGCGSPNPPLRTITYQETRAYPDLATLPIGSVVYRDTVAKDYRPAYKHLAGLDFETFRYRVGDQQLIGYAAFPQGPGPYPTIIYSRGGKYDLGTWDMGRAALRLGSLAAAGFAVITYEYGDGTPDPAADEFGGKDVEYLTALIDTLAYFPKADPSRIGLYGWSRGAMMSFLALRDRPARIEAIAAGGAPSDMEALLAARPEIQTVFTQLIPDYAADPEFALARRSPIRHVRSFPSGTPVLLLHGTADRRVPVAQAKQMAAALTQAGIPNRLELFTGEGHGIEGELGQVHDLVVAWFSEHLYFD